MISAKEARRPDNRVAGPARRCSWARRPTTAMCLVLRWGAAANYSDVPGAAVGRGGQLQQCARRCTPNYCNCPML